MIPKNQKIIPLLLFVKFTLNSFKFQNRMIKNHKNLNR